MKTETHIFKLPRRTLTLTIVEETNCVKISTVFDKHGSHFNDGDLLWGFIAPYLHRYDNDPRPVIVEDSHGVAATIAGDGSAMMVERHDHSQN